jgi:biopolymer transport protein ExbB/TolQ
MKGHSLLNKKIGLYILIWVLIISAFFSINQWNRNLQLKKEIYNIRKEIKKDLEKKINERESIIKRLRKDNEFKRSEIDRMNKSIDSLSKVKNKVRIKYISIVKDINNMDSEQIKNYWNEEFN